MNFNKRRISLTAAFLLALILRCIILVEHRWDPHRPSEPFFFSEAARNFLNGKGLSWNGAYRDKVYATLKESGRFMELDEIPLPQEERLEPWRGRAPGYVGIVIFVFWLMGTLKFFYVRLLAVFLDSAAIFFMNSIGARVSGDWRAGQVSAWVYALWIPNAIVSHLPNHDGVMAFFVLASLWTAWRAVETDRPWAYIMAAMAAATGMYIRQEPFLFPFLWGFGLFLLKGPRPALLRGGAMMMIILLAMAPWSYRNKKLDGRWYFLMPEIWMSIYLSVWEYDYARRFSLPPTEDVIKEALTPRGIALRTPESEAVFKTRCLDVIRKAPIWFLINVMGRQVMRYTLYPITNWTFLAREPWLAEYRARGGTIVGYLIHYPVNFIARFFGKASESLFFVLALVGIWIKKHEWRRYYFLWIIPLYYIAGYSAIHAGPSYILPGKTPLLILSSVALVAFWDRWRSKRTLLNHA
ncbi:MAG: glycosyltransferase family 39 protein [Elusimicrobia bacterium]|nr:glycosyltransferase family 39 protein [Elusimicrobiota bacterium]